MRRTGGGGDQGWKTRTLCKTAHSLPTTGRCRQAGTSLLCFLFFLRPRQGSGDLLPLCASHLAKSLFSVSTRPDSPRFSVQAEKQREETGQSVKSVRDPQRKNKTVVSAKKKTTHHVIAIADNRLNALGQTPLLALYQSCFGRLAFLV